MAIGLVSVILDGLCFMVEKVLLFPVEIDKSLTIDGEETWSSETTWQTFSSFCSQ